MPMSPRRLILVGNQRSGTTFLQRFLDSSTSVTFHGEVLLGMSGPRHVTAPSILHRQRLLRHFYGATLSGGLFAPGRVLRDTFDQSTTPTVGCRIMYNQMSPLVHRALAANPAVEIIHLRRRNKLRQFVSRLQMRSRIDALGAGYAHRNAGIQAVRVDPHRLQAEMDRVAKWERDLEERHSSLIGLRLEYEDLFDDAGLRLSTRRDIESFVGASDFDDHRGTSKTGTVQLDEVVLNWPEVRRALTGTVNEWMLESGA